MNKKQVVAEIHQTNTSETEAQALISPTHKEVCINSTTFKTKTDNINKEVVTNQPRSTLSSISEESCISFSSGETINNSMIKPQQGSYCSNTFIEEINKKVECLTKCKNCCSGCVDCCCITLCSL